MRLALEQVERSLRTNTVNLNALALKAALLRHLDRKAHASAVITETLALDHLCFRAIAERYLLTRENRDLSAFIDALEGDVQTLLDVAYDLAWSGLREDAYVLLQAGIHDGHYEHPMLLYTLSWLAASFGDEQESIKYVEQAEAASPRYCFPARLKK